MAVAFARQLALVALSTTAYIAELAEAPQPRRIERLCSSSSESAAPRSSPAAIIETCPCLSSAQRPSRQRRCLHARLPGHKRGPESGTHAVEPPPPPDLGPRADCSERALPECVRRRAFQPPSTIHSSAASRGSAVARAEFAESAPPADAPCACKADHPRTREVRRPCESLMARPPRLSSTRLALARDDCWDARIASGLPPRRRVRQIVLRKCGSPVHEFLRVSVTAAHSRRPPADAQIVSRLERDLPRTHEAQAPPGARVAVRRCASMRPNRAAPVGSSMRRASSASAGSASYAVVECDERELAREHLGIAGPKKWVFGVWNPPIMDGITRQTEPDVAKKRGAPAFHRLG
ncbi:hypothetical protein B0H15DRAFT_982851 [Mycena belliarum]|uniref:Uncharacterized protein n=1 Tax=Mycena belliarum TaxID=1033014 RepID=A0AAD6XNR1_9AGAR|nr:hypothetical protein B0H15DRAFT_982851 [Mycena belliae]